jgi:hypothetical protein
MRNLPGGRNSNNFRARLAGSIARVTSKRSKQSTITDNIIVLIIEHTFVFAVWLANLRLRTCETRHFLQTKFFATYLIISDDLKSK